MGIERVLLAYILFAGAIVLLGYILYRILWYKTIIPEAKYEKWHEDEINEAKQTAKRILKGKK